MCPAEAFLLAPIQRWARGLPAWWPEHLMGAGKAGQLFHSSQTPEVKKLQVWVQNLPLTMFLILNEVWESLLKKLSQTKTACYFGVFSNTFLTMMWARNAGSWLRCQGALWVPDQSVPWWKPVLKNEIKKKKTWSYVKWNWKRRCGMGGFLDLQQRGKNLQAF